MKTVPLEFDYEVTEEDKEIDVVVSYRCNVGRNQWLYPMKIRGSIYKGKTLQEFINEGLKKYNKKYKLVEVGKVEIDIP